MTESFFIGITLPESFRVEVEMWRRRFAAPKTAPHITVIPPFEWSAADGDLEKTVEESLAGLGSFPIIAQEIGHFGTSVIFVAVSPSPEIMTLHKQLVTGLSLEYKGSSRSRPRPYHPHITLATRLTPGAFHTYMEKLHGYAPQASFTCSQVTIFKLVTQGRIRRWQVWREVPVGSR
ncbi:MAG: 2'-5' RNA ligase family protein [Firmicutes bacterium]|nr:2'-5' RNA ligase family protein [Bacillota bacterium]